MEAAGFGDADFAGDVAEDAVEVFEVLEDGVGVSRGQGVRLWSRGVLGSTYCVFSSMMLCRFFPRTHPRLRSEQRRHGGPLSSMMHLILCLRHAAQALIFREI